jgi:hypothetical protein
MDCDKTFRAKYHHNLVHKTNISKIEERHNGNDNNDIDISDDGGEAPNDNNDHKQPQNVDLAINRPSTSRIIKISNYLRGLIIWH